MGIIRRGHSFSSPGSWTQMALGLKAQRAKIYKNTHFALFVPKEQKSIKIHILHINVQKLTFFAFPMQRYLSRTRFYTFRSFCYFCAFGCLQVMWAPLGLPKTQKSTKMTKARFPVKNLLES